MKNGPRPSAGSRNRNERGLPMNPAAFRHSGADVPRRPFRRGIAALLPLLLLFCAAFRGLSAAAEPLDYSDPRNWVIPPETLDGKVEDGTLFDLFYIYPTLVSGKEKPLMDHLDPKVRRKTRGFASAQTLMIFGRSARVYAPYVRQLEYTRCIAEAADPEAWERGGMRQGIEDTAAAFRFYFRRLRQGRPFILLGHSQGAIDLYLLLRNTPEINPENGFAVAYLPGLPRLTAEKFDADFKDRPIRLARRADDVAVVAVWNTQSPAATESPFTAPGCVGINPLDWSTSGEAVPAERNPESMFYDYRRDESLRIPHFCGAKLDPATGALLVDLPPMSRYDAKGFMGRGVFHMNDIWFFAGNLRDNALLRVRALRETAAPATKSQHKEPRQ